MIESESFAGERGPGTPAGPPTPETTGRFIVVFAREETDPAAVLSSAGLSDIADARDLRGAPAPESAGAEAVVFPHLKMAVVSAEPERLAAMEGARGPGGGVLLVSPELIHHVLAPPSDGTGYLQGYRDGVGDLARRLEAGGAAAGTAAVGPAVFSDNAQFTWGLQATQVASSPYSGSGIRVAVLDTGFDAGHPDFAGRTVTMESFIHGEDARDGHGHGTHCIGTACGSRTPATGPRYGVAHGAEIYAGKVLSNAGSGSDGGILAGIDWALGNGCAVISMSLGANVAEVHPPYTVAGRRCLDQGTLVIAAAGNNADRVNNEYGFVGPPANSPYIMAVGALNQQLDVSFFSARSLPGRGGQVDVAGPGYQVYSSWPLPTRYRTISGTSMATPHVAGIAALLAEATGFRGRELWAELVQESQRLLAPSVDVGSGLVLAPQSGTE